MKRTIFLGAIALAVSTTLAISASAAGLGDKYKGKSIKIVYGYGSGGTYGKTSILLSRHIGKYIPGNPTVYTQSMPGAGGLKSANYAANAMPKAGHDLLMPPDMSIVSQLLRPKKVKYDVRDFRWLGRVFGSNNMTVVRRDTGIKTIQDAMKRQVIMGSTGKGSPTYIVTSLLNGLAGTKFKIVTGYKGAARTKQAMEQGEVKGVSLAWASWKTDKAAWFKGNNSFAVPLAQNGFEPDKEWPNIPLVRDLVKGPGAKAAADLIATNSLLGRGLVLPPGAPKALVAPLRAAFWKAVNSPAFIAEAAKVKLPLGQKKAEEIHKTVNKVLNISPAAVANARKAVFGK
jgi:tripartite-type tricarboxylate transporter receptor subunit TctC